MRSTCQDRARSLPNLARLTQFASSPRDPGPGDRLLASPDDPELTQFPPHCMAGTPGQGRIPATAHPDSVVLPVGRGFAASCRRI